MPGVNTANGLGWTAGQICWVSSVISISILLWLHLNNALGFLIRIRITKNGKYVANRGGERPRANTLAAGQLRVMISQIAQDIQDMRI